MSHPQPHSQVHGETTPGARAVHVESARLEVVPGLSAVVDRLRSGDLGAAAVDIPIGLPPGGPRRCDTEARALLGARRSSVFPAPARAVLAATTYPEACALSRAAGGRAISKQLFHILPKIREVDDLLAAGHRPHVFEASPELSFALMAGGMPMAHPKRTPEGRAERLAALAAHGFDEPAVPRSAPLQGARPDDVLDALALAWTAWRRLGGRCIRLGGEADARGVRMEITA